MLRRSWHCPALVIGWWVVTTNLVLFRSFYSRFEKCKIRKLIVGTGNPRQSAASVSIMVPCHNALKPDPYSATPFMSSTLSFVLSSKDKMCHINVSPEGLESSFLFYKIFTDLHLIICTYHSLQYFKERFFKIQSQETVAPIISIISSLQK